MRTPSGLLFIFLLCLTNLQAQQDKIPAQWIATFCPKPGDCGSLHHVMIAKNGTLLTWAPGEAFETLPFLDHVVAVASQTFFILALKDDGTVWAWGDNHGGQLGNPDYARKMHSDRFVQVVGLAHVKAISAISATAGQSCYALLEDGTVWTWGNDHAGKPIQVQGIANVVAIAGSMALLKDGTVWTWGNGTYGRLGNGSTAHTATPVQVNGIHDAVAISARDDGALVLLRDGSVWAWGHNYKGQVGPQGHVQKYSTDSDFNATPVQVTGIANAVAIDADAVCLALLKDGTVKAWGWGAIGGMGRGVPGTHDFNAIPATVPAVTNAVAIKAGDGNGFALLKDGTIMGWGGDMVKGGVYHQTWTPVVIGHRE